MDRFQNLEEYVRRSAPSPERDAESSLPDDASMTDEQLDALDAMGDEAGEFYDCSGFFTFLPILLSYLKLI